MWRHPDVDDRDIRAMGSGPSHQIPRVGGGCHHVKARCSQNLNHPGSKERLVFSYDDAYR
jgi:hypothetical protein